ncbi:hypothetical protein BXZ70DRAFT_1051497 [Cristinia sonorae]|uniref:Uncharacterized protein n=1 Tax=Cristinia sonorae TaxID=1940300 RepID=A0A8K0XSC9_9AGAR|nr:hypothetical protein BXZ70DRAFT_1051497 [Cristinia sonorae]
MAGPSVRFPDQPLPPIQLTKKVEETEEGGAKDKLDGDEEVGVEEGNTVMSAIPRKPDKQTPTNPLPILKAMSALIGTKTRPQHRSRIGTDWPVIWPVTARNQGPAVIRMTVMTLELGLSLISSNPLPDIYTSNMSDFPDDVPDNFRLFEHYWLDFLVCLRTVRQVTSKDLPLAAVSLEIVWGIVHGRAGGNCGIFAVPPGASIGQP